MTLHAERRQPLRDEHADPAEADDADGLLVQLDAGVLRPLPLAVLQRGVGRADVPGGGEHQRDGELGGGDDVGGRRVDDHDAGLGRGLDVDVVEADTGAGDDLEPPGRGQRLGVDLGRGAHQDRVDVGDRRAAARRGRRRCSWRISKSGPSASTVAGLSSSAMSTTGLVTGIPSRVVGDCVDRRWRPARWSAAGRARRCARSRHCTGRDCPQTGCVQRRRGPGPSSAGAADLGRRRAPAGRCGCRRAARPRMLRAAPAG